MGRVRIDLTGQKFGAWTVSDQSKLEAVGVSSLRSMWFCKCSCGHEQWVALGSLRSGNTLGCRACSHLKIRETHIKLGIRPLAKSQPSEDYSQTISTYRWGKIKDSAKDRGHEFLITKDYILDLYFTQNQKCALTAVPILFGKRYSECGSASLDRINSDSGYIEGNVQWVHKDINRMKQVFTQSRFIELCHLVAANH